MYLHISVLLNLKGNPDGFLVPCMTHGSQTALQGSFSTLLSGRHRMNIPPSTMIPCSLVATPQGQQARHHMRGHSALFLVNS